MRRQHHGHSRGEETGVGGVGTGVDDDGGQGPHRQPGLPPTRWQMPMPNLRSSSAEARISALWGGQRWPRASATPPEPSRSILRSW